MKKVFAFMALVASVIFSGCSSDSSSPISGGTPYSGEEIGTWVCNVSNQYETYTEKITLLSDGTATYYYEEDGWWSTEYCLFYIQGDILALSYKYGVSSDGESYNYETEGDSFVEYYYIKSSTEMYGFEGEESASVDFTYAENHLDRTKDYSYNGTYVKQ